MTCPKCGFQTDFKNNSDCPACGLVFEKWSKQQTPASPPQGGGNPTPSPVLNSADQVPDESYLLTHLLAAFQRVSLKRFPEWAHQAKEGLRPVLA